MLALDGDVAAGSDLGFQHRVLSQAPHQDAGAPVDEALRPAAHAGRRTACPLPDASRPANAPDQRSQSGRLATKVQVRTCAMRCESVSMSPSVRSSIATCAREPVVRDRAMPASGSGRAGRRGRHGCGRDLAVIGTWQTSHSRSTAARALREVADVGLPRQDVERAARPRRSARASGRVRSACTSRLACKRADRAEIEVGIAPLQMPHRLETVVLQRVDELGVEGRAAPGGAEGAVAQVAAGAAGDLAELGRRRGLRKLVPSNLRSAAKATWSTSRLRPMPIASVATR